MFNILDTNEKSNIMEYENVLKIWLMVEYKIIKASIFQHSNPMVFLSAWFLFVGVFL